MQGRPRCLGWGHRHLHPVPQWDVAHATGPERLTENLSEDGPGRTCRKLPIGPAPLTMQSKWLITHRAFRGGVWRR